MLGWVDFRFFWRRRSLPAGRSIACADLIFIFLRSRAHSTRGQGPFAVLLSAALACSLGCGPSSVLCKRFEAFSFFFSEKNDEDLFLADFLKNWRRHGMAARLHNNFVAKFRFDTAENEPARNLAL